MTCRPETSCRPDSRDQAIAGIGNGKRVPTSSSIGVRASKSSSFIRHYHEDIEERSESLLSNLFHSFCSSQASESSNSLRAISASTSTTSRKENKTSQIRRCQRSDYKREKEKALQDAAVYVRDHEVHPAVHKENLSQPIF
jgi:hypothetical protein